MKKLFIVFSLAVALIGFMTFNAVADQITGAISFSGTVVPNDPNLSIATEILSYTDAVVSSTGGSGDYASALSGQPVTFTPFQFYPALSPKPLVPLWTFAIGQDIYSFDATEINFTTLWRMSHTLAMSGLGIAHITGFDDTPGVWALSANTAGATASFSASTGVPVPEPASLMLLGLGLLGIGTAARIKIKK